MKKGISSQQRYFIYLAIAAILPIILVICQHRNKISDLEALSLEMVTYQKQLTEKKKKNESNRLIKQAYSEADHFFIDKQLETMVFLEPELSSIQKFYSQNKLPLNSKDKSRIDFLTSGDNSLVFSEGSITRYEGFQEVMETLVVPVEVNITDTKRLLSQIEGASFDGISPPKNKPQMIITEFKLEKTTGFQQNEVFKLQIKLLKREYQ